MNNAEIIELTHRHMVDVYGCLPLAFARGHGAYLYDADGNRYLDFFCGLAVTSLGHGNPRVVRAIKEQAEKLTHVSNVFHTEASARLVERLIATLDADPEVEEAWAAEVERRHAEIESGAVSLLPGPETLAKLKAICCAKSQAVLNFNQEEPW